MPQMAPMWWTLIMIFSILFLYMMISVNYFSFTKKVKIGMYKSFNKKMNWTW
nr:ATP synthase F0 subunit 8 [Selenocephalus sp.]